MPIRASEKARYPANWKEIRARILRRAGDTCEWVNSDGVRCDAPNGELIFRRKDDLEQWRGLYSNDMIEEDPSYKAVKIVLTTAHLSGEGGVCNCRVETGRYCGIDSHLASYCQLHHLRYDAQHHATNAAETRKTKRDAGRLLLEAH